MTSGQRLQNSLAYPRTYRANGGWRIALILCGGGIFVGGLAASWYFASATLKDPQSRPWIIALFLTLAIFGGYCLLSTLRSAIVLFPDRIEVRELTSTKMMGRDEISGWRLLPSTSPPVLALYPKDPDRRPLKFAQIFRFDPEFEDWLFTLPSLDREEQRRSKAEIRREAALGVTPAERMHALHRGRRTAMLFAVISGFVCFWGFFYPDPYSLVIFFLVLLPWIAVAMVRSSHGLFRIDAGRSDAHPTVATAFVFPGMILVARAAFDYEVIPSQGMLWFPILIGSILCFFAIWVDASQRTKKAGILALLACSIFYGYGVAILADVILDHSSEKVYKVHVTGKHIDTYKGVKYELELPPWGPKTKSNRYRVDRATYDAIKSGDVAYFVVKPGALGIGWYFMRQWTRQQYH